MMENLFTDTSVLLSQDYIDSVPKDNLDCKLDKLRLVCHTSYTNVDTTYVISGKWDQINLAFELLEHWRVHPDHEPSIADLRNGPSTSLCDCDVVKTILTNIDTGLQNESESRILDVDLASPHETRDQLIACLIRETNIEDNNCVKTTGKKKLNLNVVERNGSGFNSVDAVTDGNNFVNDDVEVLKTTNESNNSKVANDNIVNIYIENSENLECRSTSLEFTPSSLKYNGTVKQNLSDDKLKQTDLECKPEKKKGEKRSWSRLKRTDGDIAHQCTQCDVVLKSRKRYLEHLRRIHLKEYQCQQCGKGFGYPTDLKRHNCKTEFCSKPAIRKTKKKTLPSLSCLECEYKTTTNARLKNHVLKVHSLKYKCDQCEKKFTSSADLEKHTYNSHSEKSYYCDQCTKCYKNKQGLDAHLKTHISDYVKPSFPCTMCSKSFTTSHALKTHVKSGHLGVKKFCLCQICGKKFSQRSSYRQHLNAHNRITPYKCSKCDREFVYHKSLKEHEFMHDNIRRFHCKICDKAFRQKTVLHIHMKTHKTVKDHRCSVCGRGFSQKQAMERHERIHSGVRPYECQICKKSFGDTSTIRRHMIAIHKQTETNWRLNVISTSKKQSDHYVIGGSGQNRTYKYLSTTRECSDKESPLTHTESSQVSKETTTLSDTNVLVLNSTSSQSDGGKVNMIGGSINSINQNPSSVPQLQLNTLYALAANQQQPLHTQNSDTNGLVLPTQIKNNLPQIFDFSNVTFVTTKLPQTINNRTENNENLQQIQIQADGNNVLQTATLIPLSGVSESLKLNQSDTNIQNIGDSSMSPAIWGFVGYPSYTNTENYTQYPSQ
ncbi:hypothetical protein ACF0H5_011107 [Mactra antiquata]